MFYIMSQLTEHSQNILARFSESCEHFNVNRTLVQIYLFFNIVLKTLTQEHYLDIVHGTYLNFFVGQSCIF